MAPSRCGYPIAWPVLRVAVLPGAQYPRVSALKRLNQAHASCQNLKTQNQGTEHTQGMDTRAKCLCYRRIV